MVCETKVKLAMKILFILIVILVLACLCVLFFYDIQINTETAELFFYNRKASMRSFLLSYKQGFKFCHITDIENDIPGWKIPEAMIHGEEDIALPFTEGETLIYDVYSAGIKTGQSRLTFHGERPLNGESAYYITFITELPFFKDYEDIYAEIGSFLPLKIKRKIEKMGGLSTEEIEEEYNQAIFSVTIKKKGAFSTKKTIIQKDSPIHNAILLTYLCRANPELADKDNFKAVLPTQEFHIKISEEETIETPLGKYSTDVFESQPPNFTFYLSKDEDRLPVKITSHTVLSYTMILSAKESNR
jgi:hypothetical protein